MPCALSDDDGIDLWGVLLIRLTAPLAGKGRFTIALPTIGNPTLDTLGAVARTIAARLALRAAFWTTLFPLNRPYRPFFWWIPDCDPNLSNHQSTRRAECALLC